jgi:hypothetical protein
VVVCEVVVSAELVSVDVPDAALEVESSVVAVVEPVVAELELDVPEELFVLTAAVCVLDAMPSRHASAPPSDSIEATLSAVAALRARAARGLRRGVGIRSSMPTNVRIGRERAARGA